MSMILSIYYRKSDSKEKVGLRQGLINNIYSRENSEFC